MPDQRFPTIDEFWKRLEAREVEPDLRDALELRTSRELRPVERIGRQPTVVAVVERLLPVEISPRALASFLDEVFDRQMGRGDETAGLLPRAQLIPAGFAALDEAAAGRGAASFADLDVADQDALLGAAELGDLTGPEGFASAEWFKRVRDLLLLGFGSDPRGMVQMGFPGPSYKPGHIWLDPLEVEARARRRPGYLKL